MTYLPPLIAIITTGLLSYVVGRSHGYGQGIDEGWSWGYERGCEDAREDVELDWYAVTLERMNRG